MNFYGAPYPITKHPRGFLHTQPGIDQIKSDLLVLLLTSPGERCFPGDTSISLANGTETRIIDVIDQEYFWIYSFDTHSNTVVPGKAKAFKTASDVALLEITLDNEAVVRCTPNHLWMMRDGTYKEACQLTSGDSLMPLYRNLNTSGYERVYQPLLQNYRETHLCFVDGKRIQGLKEVVHHKNLNKRDNSPDNLQWMTRKEHKQLHKEISNAFVKKMKEDPEFRANFIMKVKSGLTKHYEDHDGNRKGAVLSDKTKKILSDNKKELYKTKDGNATKQLLRDKALKQFKEKGHPSTGRKHSLKSIAKMKRKRPSMIGDSNPSKRPEVREKLRLAWETRKLKNHKVVSVKTSEIKEDCYDLHVEKYNNFALSAGVFVHNCMLPQFGTPLRTLQFEPNDPLVIQQAKTMIANSISMWEPRVTIQNITVTNGMAASELNPLDTCTEQNSILGISISFFDPENMSDVQQLQLEIPLGGS